MMAILKYITKHQPRYMATSAGGVPERIIRNEFGNNPDTSKALRFLVTENKIVRGGQGGRRDPFSYTLATASPAASAEENAGDPGHGHSAKDTAAAQALVAATPAVIAMQADSATAAAAALAAPSTGKLPAPLARQGSRRKPLQPRLSLDLDLAVAVHREVDEEARRAAAATVGAKRPASVAFTPQPATLAPPAMRPSAALETAVAATPKPPTGDASAADAGGDVTTVAAVQSLIKGGKEGMLPPSTIMAPKLTIPDLNGTPVLAPINDRFAHWPSQLPTTQRLSAVASPPAAHTAAQQTGGHTPGSGVFLFPSPSGQMVAAPPNAQAAYLLQLQAAQMYWQQMAAQQHGRTPLGAGPVPPMPAAIPSAVAGPPAVAATPPV